MLRSSRASSGPFAVIFACSLAAACSSTGSGSHAPGGAASNEGDSASAGHDASAAGARQVDTNAGGASTSGVDSSLAGVPADDDGSLRRSELDGSMVTTIVPAGGSFTPKQLKLDLGKQQLYWSDREGMRIQRAAIDGSDIETLVTVASGASARKNAQNWCVGLARDLVHGFVYWTQKGPDNGMVGSIRRAHLQMPSGQTDTTRSDIEMLFEGLPEPVDLDLDVSGGYMYWTDRGDDTLSRAPIEIPNDKTATTRADREILVKGVREAIGVTLDLERGHVYYTSGASGRVGRANLDGGDAHDLVTGSGALTGIALAHFPSH